VKLSFGKSKLESEKIILFVCVENAGRSQMAEGFFNKSAPEGYRAVSAGTKPVSQINRVVIDVMRQVGIDISNQKSKEITEDMMRNSFKTVNMGCMDKESCPTLFLPNVIDWNLEDPRDKPIEKVREIMHEVEQRVKELVAGLKTHQ
jgi:arsenate reductase (thioredoxin)